MFVDIILVGPCRKVMLLCKTMTGRVWGSLDKPSYGPEGGGVEAKYRHKCHRAIRLKRVTFL